MMGPNPTVSNPLILLLYGTTRGVIPKSAALRLTLRVGKEAC